MAGRSQREISIQYRRLEGVVLPSQNFSLSAAIKHALNEKKDGTRLRDDWHLREFDFANEEALIMNWFAEDDEYFLGEIVGVEPGGLLTAAKRQGASGAFFEVAQVSTDAGDEPYLGAVYFLARGNHVLVAEDGLAARRVEYFLEWLFGVATDVASGVPIYL